MKLAASSQTRRKRKEVACGSQKCQNNVEKTCYIIFKTFAVLCENREEGRWEGRWEGEAIKWDFILYSSY